MTATELPVRVVVYICEEVRRQGHDLSDPADGGYRVGGMVKAWEYAFARRRKPPTVDDVLTLGRWIEDRNESGFRTVGVRVGAQRVEGEAETLIPRVTDLLTRFVTMKSLDFYRAFEEIHPFIDGNGRTGKVLLNWRNRTLLSPIFPPADFWGRRIQNP